MANAPVQFADSDIRIDSVVVAKVTGITRDVNVTEDEVTGTEDVSGSLVQMQFLPVAVDETIQVNYIYKSGDTQSKRLEPGQLDIEDAVLAGSSVVLRVLDQNDYGYDYTGHFTSFQETGELKTAWKGSCQLHVTSRSAVSPA